jgi:exonuclease SbcC
MKNITFNTLSISNFLSIGKEIVINFKNGIHIITGYNLDKEDGNGVGKSTIQDAFFFVLFGETLRDLKKDEIVNNLAKKNCKVILNFDIDKNGVKNNYTIERGLVPSYCKIFIDDKEEKTLSTIPVTNGYILNLINSTQAVFRNTITMGINNTVPFMAQKKNEKREFIEGILRLEMFKIMNKVAKENHDVIFKDYEFTTKSYEENNRNILTYLDKKDLFEKNRKSKIDYLLQRREQYQIELDNLKNSIIPIDEEIFKKMQQDLMIHLSNSITLEQNQTSLIRSSSEVSSDLKQTENSLAKTNKELLTLKEVLEKFGNDIIDTEEEITKTVTTESNNIDVYKSKILELERDIKDLFNNIKAIKEIGSFCDKCKRAFPDNDIKKNENDIEAFKKQIEDKTIIRQEYQVKLENTKQVIINKTSELEKRRKKNETLAQITLSANLRKTFQENIEDLKKQLEARNITLNETIRELKSIKDSCQNLQNTVNETKAKKEKNESINKLIANTKISYENCTKDIQKIELEKNEFEDMLDKAEINKNDLEKKIANYKEKVAIYDIIKFVVSDEGVKSFIIKKLLGILNERISYYLIKMDANCVLTFDEYFEDKIINDREQQCSYYNFSAGERKRIDLACLFAFMDLRRIQGDVTFNITFYDELLDSALSKDGSEKVFQILKERLDKYNEMAYIITHRRENLKNPLINDIIYLEKLGGITRLGEFKK